MNFYCKRVTVYPDKTIVTIKFSTSDEKEGEQLIKEAIDEFTERGMTLSFKNVYRQFWLFGDYQTELKFSNE